MKKDSQREREKMPGLPSIVFLSVPLPALSRRGRQPPTTVSNG